MLRLVVANKLGFPGSERVKPTLGECLLRYDAPRSTRRASTRLLCQKTVQSQNTVSAYFTSEQMLPFGFTEPLLVSGAVEAKQLSDAGIDLIKVCSTAKKHA